jgi:hypothetical protein
MRAHLEFRHDVAPFASDTQGCLIASLSEARRKRAFVHPKHLWVSTSLENALISMGPKTNDCRACSNLANDAALHF